MSSTHRQDWFLGLLDSLQAVRTEVEWLLYYANNTDDDSTRLCDLRPDFDIEESSPLYGFLPTLEKLLPHNTGQSLIDSIPEDARQDLAALTGKPWKLKVRRAFDAYLTVLEKAGFGVPITKWRTEAVSVLPGVLAELSELTAQLWTLRGERYAAAGDHGQPQAGGGSVVDALQPQDLPQDAQAGAAAKLQDTAAGGDGDDQAYRELAKWAAEELKGKQQRVVVLLAQHDGRIEMKDLATDPVIDWDLPWWTKFNDMKKAINPKLHKHGWKVLRQGNVPRLTQIETGQK